MNHGTRSLSPAVILCGAVFIGFVDPVVSAQWTKSAGVTPGITYSDNVCLESENEQGEFIGTFAPSASLAGVGARANINFAGSVNINSLDNTSKVCANGRGGDPESIIPTYRMNAGVELIKSRFFIDISSSASQNSTNAFARGREDGLDRAGNLNTTYSYSISPRYNSKLFDAADVSLSYSLNEQRNSEGELGNSSSQSALFNLAGITGPGAVSWSLNANYSETQHDRDSQQSQVQPEDELISARITLGYAISRRWQINGSVGKEWNTFISSNPDDDIDGNVWDAGLVWTPNQRVRLDVGTGDRFFGNTPRLDFSYRHRRSAFTSSYVKELTYSRNLRANSILFPTVDAFGNPIDPLASVGDNGFGTPTSNSGSPTLNESFNLAWNFQGRLSAMGVSVSRSNQIRSEDAIEDTFTSATINLSRQLSRNLNPNISLFWEEREGDGARGGPSVNSETRRINLGFSRSIGDWTSMAFNYAFTKRESDSGQEDYTENRVTVTFSLSL